MAERNTKGRPSRRPDQPPAAPGTDTRRAALSLLDAVLRKGLPLEAALDSAARGLSRPEDRALALAIAAEVLRRLPDLDTLIDSATQRPLPYDAKARSVLRIALVQALVLGTPPHAAISTALPMLEGGPRRSSAPNTPWTSRRAAPARGDFARGPHLAGAGGPAVGRRVGR